ncbi:PRC-barrel domain-containing protein [Fictibacillus iocasae]|uniref:PRC-barrel domain-containing protein n=1 Tax=Fictibacillus iocasae TaxID=2715437 RepID=A0ABW2NWH8_9BACL
MLKISELIGMKIKHAELGNTEHKVDDVVFREDNTSISYLIYHVDTMKNDKGRPLNDGLINKAGTWVTGMNDSNLPSAGMIDEQDFSAAQKDTYYVPWPEIEKMEEETVIYKGSERQKSLDVSGTSWQSYKGLKVIHPDGKDLGEITDGVLNVNSGKIEGWIVTGGFWKQLMGEGTKTIQLDGKPNWAAQEWRLQSEPETLMQKQ